MTEEQPHLGNRRVEKKLKALVLENDVPIFQLVLPVGNWTLDDVQGVDDTRNVTQDGQQDVDEKVGIATSFKEDTQRREDDGKDDLADISVAGSRSAMSRAEQVTLATGSCG